LSASRSGSAGRDRSRKRFHATEVHNRIEAAIATQLQLLFVLEAALVSCAVFFIDELDSIY
jgi:hypothetical protein